MCQEKTDEYGQEILKSSERTNGIGEKERIAMEMTENLSRDGFEKLMKENELDATENENCHWRLPSNYRSGWL